MYACRNILCLQANFGYNYLQKVIALIAIDSKVMILSANYKTIACNKLQSDAIFPE